MAHSATPSLSHTRLGHLAAKPFMGRWHVLLAPLHYSRKVCAATVASATLL